MEQLISRLDVAMFNAILRESAGEMPTDPVSDPISDINVLPIPAGKASFGAGAQLKNAVLKLSHEHSVFDRKNILFGINCIAFCRLELGLDGLRINSNQGKTMMKIEILGRSQNVKTSDCSIYSTL